VSGAVCWWCLATVTTSLPCVLRRQGRGFPPEIVANQRLKDPNPLRLHASPQQGHQAFVQHAVVVNDHGDGVDAPSCSCRLARSRRPSCCWLPSSTRSGRWTWSAAIVGRRDGPDQQVHPPGSSDPPAEPDDPDPPPVDGIDSQGPSGISAREGTACGSSRPRWPRPSAPSTRST
jgi:hypothetical protein